jgi:four helix bundle protein
MPFTLDSLEVYQLSEKMADKIWAIVMQWNAFAMSGMGKQLTNAADSISANIAEGYGRHFIKENLHFCFYARGSLLETRSWLRKAGARNLVSEEELINCIKELEIIHRKLNAYMKLLRENKRSGKAE